MICFCENLVITVSARYKYNSQAFNNPTKTSWFFIVLFLFVLTPVIMVSQNVTASHFDSLEYVFGRVQYAALLIRHGDRNPLRTYPNDPYKNYEWPGGIANLNKKGKSKLYSLGKWLRNRYRYLAPAKLENDGLNFAMHSSDANITRQSGEYLQYGFYNLSESALESLEEENWKLVEIQIIPEDEDNVLGLRRQRQCKYFLERKRHLYSVPTIRKKLVEQDELVSYVAKHAGYDFSNSTLNEQYDILADVFDTITSQAENGVQLPAWASKIFPKPFDDVANSRMRIKNHDPVCLRFTAGPFLKMLITEMKEHVTEGCNITRPVLHFFIGYDYVSMVVMSALDTFNNLIPPYANAIIFELRKKGEFNMVTMSLKNTTSGPLYPLEIPACGPSCTLETFFKIIENCHILPDWDSACNKPYRMYR